jgi:hypothetical protein
MTHTHTHTHDTYNLGAICRWRHSYFANFYVYSISAKTATLLDDQNRRLMNPVWAASGNIVLLLLLLPCDTAEGRQLIIEPRARAV